MIISSLILLVVLRQLVPAFSITITAKASNGNTLTSYTGRPTLSVSTGTISPTVTGAFSSGVWTGSVTATGAGSDVTIMAIDGSSFWDE